MSENKDIDAAVDYLTAAQFWADFKEGTHPLAAIPSWKATKQLITTGALDEKWVRDSGVYPEKMPIKTLWNTNKEATCTAVSLAAVGGAAYGTLISYAVWNMLPTLASQTVPVYEQLLTGGIFLFGTTVCALSGFVGNTIRLLAEDSAYKRSPASVILSRPITTPKPATDPA